jgi:hypothetical protein
MSYVSYEMKNEKLKIRNEKVETSGVGFTSRIDILPFLHSLILLLNIGF